MSPTTSAASFERQLFGSSMFATVFAWWKMTFRRGAYRPADLARAVAFSSRYKRDLLTVDAAGGGTGMSPWHMMNERGVPPVELHSLLYSYAKRLADKGDHLPALALGGGFSFEDHIFKGLALGAPFVKLIGMARAPVAAAMVGKTIGRAIEVHDLPVYVQRFGDTMDETFVTAGARNRIRAMMGALPATPSRVD